MPQGFEGFSDQPNVQVSEGAPGGGKAYRKPNTSAGFEGHSEDNLAESAALKAKKGSGPPAAQPSEKRSY